MMEREAGYITGNWWRTEDAWREGGETWLDLSKATRIQFVQAPDGEWQCEVWAGQTFILRGAEAERLRNALMGRSSCVAEDAMLEQRVSALECWRLCQEGDGR